MRILRGVVLFRGRISGSLTAGVTTQIGTVPSGFRPPADDSRAERAGVNTSDGLHVYLRVAAGDGALLCRPITTATISAGISALSGYSVD